MRKNIFFICLICLLSTFAVANTNADTGTNNQDSSNQSQSSTQKKTLTGLEMKGIQENQKNLGEFQVQDIMQNMLGAEGMDRINSGDISSMTDSKITDIKTPAVESYVNAKRSGKIDEAIKSATQSIGNTAKTTGRVSCYIARGQSFYNYQCSLNGISYTSPDNSQSPTKAKQTCESNCYTAGQCYEVEGVASASNTDKTEKLGSVTFDSKNLNPYTFSQTFSNDNKAKYVSFEISSNAPVLFSFDYTDESGYKRVMANNIPIAATGTEETKDNDKDKLKKVTKRYNLTQKVASLNLSFSVPKEHQDKEDLEIKVDNIILFVPKESKFACSGQNLYFKDEKRKNCNKDSRVLLQSANGPIEICKTGSSGDNEDGTFSTREGCQAACRTNGSCIFTQPTINAQQFFGFQEGCLLDSANCSNTACKSAREQNAPILSEKVYDSKGNMVETIKDGIPVPNTVRPRIVAEDSKDYNEKMQLEGKALAFANMVKNQTYNTTLQLFQTRKSSYAIRAESNNGSQAKELFVRVKPSNALYKSTAYLYLMVRVESVSKDFITLPPCDNTDKNGQYSKDKDKECKARDTSFNSYHYFLLNESGQAEGFYRNQGYNRGEFTHNGNNYQTFNGLKWVEGGEYDNAPVFKTYNNLLQSLDTNKYFIEEKITNNSYNFLAGIKGLPKVRAFASFAQDSYTNPYAGMLGEIYTDVKSNNDIPVHILAQNQGRNPKLKGVEVATNYVVYALISDKALTKKEIGDELIAKEKTTLPDHAIYNLLELDNTNYRIRLESDGIMGDERVELYLVGDNNKLSAYANVNTVQEDIGENGYLFYWLDNTIADSAKGSITHLNPDNREIREFKQFMPTALETYEVFKNKDFSKESSQSVKFGYGTGKYDKDSDCKVINTNGKAERICLPWWRVEREYDSNEDRSIANKDFRELMGKMKLPAQGKFVSVCTKIDPLANAIYNQEQQTITCTSYYNRLAGEDCYSNPLQKKCFYDNCPTKVKETCTLVHTIGFADLKTKVQVDDVTAAGQDINQLQETKIEVKTYGYKCPKSANIELNQVCLQQESVLMQPAVCSSSGTTGSTSASSTTTSTDTSNTSDALEHATIDEVLSGKSNLIYCSTANPIIDLSGNLKGFKGTCPNTREQVTCGVEPISSTKQTCIDPIIQKQKEEKVDTITEERLCNDVFVDVGKGENDIFKDDPSCYRANTAADSRKGTISINFRQDIEVRGLLISKNKESQQTVEYCTYNGAQGKMQGNCTSNSGKKVLNFITTLKDSEEILFAEQISRTSNGAIFDNWEKGKAIDSNYVYGTGYKNDAYYDSSYKVYAYGSRAYDNAIKNGVNMRGRMGDAIPAEFVSGAMPEYQSSAVTASTGGTPISILPDLRTLNFSLRWRSCGAPNIKEPSFDDIVRMGYFPTSGYFDMKDPKVGGIAAAVYTGGLALPFVIGGYHCHFEKWKLRCMVGCHAGRHYSQHSENKLNIFFNADVGLSILFPTPSNYEIYFFNTKGELMHKESVTASKLTTKSAGEMNALRLGDKAKLYENGKEVTTRLGCSDDDLSPAGGGTLYGLHSVTKAPCPIAREKSFILENSIASVSIIDLETRTTTTKQLTYPLPFINRIYYGYAQSVETRRYKCCENFNH